MLGNYIFPNQSGDPVLWGLSIVLYPFMTCSIFGTFLVFAMPTVFGKKTVIPARKLGLAISLSFLPFAFFPLLLHLGQPFRAFNIMSTPRFGSPMAVFGFVFSFVAVMILLQAWLVFRKDLARLSTEKRGVLRWLYTVLCLGIREITPQAEKIDRGLVKFLQCITLPVAAVLPGYVAFDFATCPGNPSWNSTLRPITFIIAGVVNGASLTLLLGSLIRPSLVPDKTVKTLGKILLGSAVLVGVFSILEVAAIAYREGDSKYVVENLLFEGGPLAPWFFKLHLGIGTGLPLVVLGFALLVGLRGVLLKFFAIAGSLLGLFQTFTLLWNSIIGGQLVSHSFRGVSGYTAPVGGKEGIIACCIVVVLPVIAFLIVNLLVPLKEPEDKTGLQTAESSA